MNTMKKVLALLMVAVLLVGMLTACAPTGQDGAAQLTGEYIVVKAQLNGLKQAWLENAAAAFTYKTGIRVEYEFDSLLNGSVQNLLETEGMELADLYFVQMNEWAKWAEAGFLTDLTLMMNQKNENGKSLNDRLIGNDRYLLDSGDKVNYIVPVTYAPTALAYNTKMMNYVCHDLLGWEEGHDYPINTKELQEVFEALEAATAAGKNPELLTYAQSGQTYSVQPMVWSGSTGYLEIMTYPWIYQYMGLDGTEAFYNQTANIDLLNHDAFYYAYQKIEDLLDLEQNADGEWMSASSVPGSPSLSHVQSQQRFVRGQALLCPTGSWFYTETSDLIKELGMENDIGFMPVPWLSDDEGNYLVADGATPSKDEDGNPRAISRMNVADYFMIPTGAQSPDLAQEFLLFMFSEEYLPTLCEDLQSPMCFEADYSQVKKTQWFGEVDRVMANITPVESWAPTTLCNYGRVQFYYNPGNQPFSRMVQCSFGSCTRLIDSATGQQIQSAAEATGIAVSENVYNYLQGNYAQGKKDFRDSKKELGV